MRSREVGAVATREGWAGKFPRASAAYREKDVGKIFGQVRVDGLAFVLRGLDEEALRHVFSEE